MSNPTLSPEHLDFLSTTFQRNRDLFAGWSMEAEEGAVEESNETSEETEESTESNDTESEESTEEESSEDESEDDEDTDEDEDGEEDKLSHDDALKALSKVRKSEAKYRTRLREAEAALKDAKTPDEFQAALEKMQQDNAADARAMLAENVALKAGLPGEWAERLKGSTREELEADAKALLRLVPSKPAADPDLSDGQGDDEGEDIFDEKAALKAARLARSRRY